MVSGTKTRVLEPIEGEILEAMQVPESRSTLRKQLYLLGSSEQGLNAHKPQANDEAKSIKEMTKKIPVIETRNKEAIPEMETRNKGVRKKPLTSVSLRKYADVVNQLETQLKMPNENTGQKVRQFETGLTVKHQISRFDQMLQRNNTL